jgi:hypothetical protein
LYEDLYARLCIKALSSAPRFDTDGSGSLSPGEFDAVFKLLGEPKTAEVRYIEQAYL